MKRDAESDAKNLYKAAWLRYCLQMKQDDIAKKVLKVDKSQVSRWIRQAEKDGLVEIRLMPLELLGLQVELEQKFGLAGSSVVPSFEPDIEQELRSRNIDEDRVHQSLMQVRTEQVAQAAAKYIGSLLRVEGGSNIGLGGGSTMSALVRVWTPFLPRISLKLFALALSSHENFASSASTITSHAVATMNFEFRRQELDAIVWQREKLDSIRVDGTALRLPTTGDTQLLEKAAEEYYTTAAKEMDLIVAGLGSMRTVPRVARIDEQYYAKLQKDGAVGDILYHFFRTDGSPIAPDHKTGIFPFTIDKLREFIEVRKKRVVVIAAGEEKIKAMRNALRSPKKFITDVITDETVARALIRGN